MQFFRFLGLAFIQGRCAGMFPDGPVHAPFWLRAEPGHGESCPRVARGLAKQKPGHRQQCVCGKGDDPP